MQGLCAFRIFRIANTKKRMRKFQTQCAETFILKGTVHPKMKILSFTHPQVDPNLYECLCSAEHKGRYFEESLESGCFGAPLTSIVGKTILWKSMVPQNCSVSTFFRISSFVFSRTNTFIQVWIYLRMNDDRIFIFGCTVPLSYKIRRQLQLRRFSVLRIFHESGPR